jgi:uncharacterized membrane protein YdbT with pleckstrin-like domain
MSYVRSHLQEGETVVYQTTVHWIVYWRAMLWLVAAAAAGALAVRASGQAYAVALNVVAIVLAAVAVVQWFHALVRRATTELAITDRRIIVKVGLIRRMTSEMNRSKVESVMVEQSVLGRLFDFGTILIKGTGGGLEPLVGIQRPIKFRGFVTAS